MTSSTCSVFIMAQIATVLGHSRDIGSTDVLVGPLRSSAEFVSEPEPSLDRAMELADTVLLEPVFLNSS
jgi:hypothetical protein